MQTLQIVVFVRIKTGISRIRFKNLYKYTSRAHTLLLYMYIKTKTNIYEYVNYL